VATLKFVNEQGEDEILRFGPERPSILVGRNKECDLRTRNNTVSRLHARFQWAGGRYTVMDLESANGTWYHKRRIEEVDIEDGESVFVGSLPVEFRLDDADRVYLGSTEMEPPPVPAPADEGRRPTAGYDSMPVQAAEVPPAPPAPAPSVVQTAAYEGVIPLASSAASPAVESPEVESVSFADEADDVPPSPATQAGAAVPPFDPPEANAWRAPRDEEREARVGVLEAELAGRDERMRQLGAQVEDLSRMVARYQSEAASADTMRVERDEALARIAGLEGRIRGLEVQADDLRREVIPAEARGALESAAVDVPLLRFRVADLEALLAEAELRVQESDVRAQGADMRAQESDAKRAEAERKAAEPVAPPAAAIPVVDEDAHARELAAAAAEAEVLAAQVRALGDEVAELKAANRSYLKKMSRLLEENVALQTAAAAAAAEAQAAVEAPAPPPVAPPPAAPPPAAEIPAELKESVARINDAISGFRTGLDVLGGLLPEILDRIPAADGDDTREQVAAALEDLGQMAKDLKVEAVKARKHL
jgi:hypothetical protein